MLRLAEMLKTTLPQAIYMRHLQSQCIISICCTPNHFTRWEDTISRLKPAFFFAEQTSPSRLVQTIVFCPSIGTEAEELFALRSTLQLKRGERAKFRHVVTEWRLWNIFILMDSKSPSETWPWQHQRQSPSYQRMCAEYRKKNPVVFRDIRKQLNEMTWLQLAICF